MSLRAIVRALGGDLYANGRRANVPAPGHSAHDRSVSLLLCDGRVVIHSFGSADWRTVRAELHRQGLVDCDGHIPGHRTAALDERPDARRRVALARALWDGGRVSESSGVVARHLAMRGVAWSAEHADLVEHPAAPLSVYRAGGRTSRAMMAGIRNPQGSITAVELTYLAPNGMRAPGLFLSRKTVGRLGGGGAVRLSPVAPEMLVAEGVMTTLSAMAAFARPGWALLSCGNLARWRAPEGVSSVLIAADRGRAGEDAALTLRRSLWTAGVEARICLPPAPWGDWNEARAGGGKRKEEGRGGAPGTRGWSPRPAGD